MEDRGFTDTFAPDTVEGRFVIECPFRRDLWHVIVEPDDAERVLVVVTAFRREV
ncbi:MAG: hypothetical protein ACOY3Y_19960 [Acidobacteriota bacterium]